MLATPNLCSSSVSPCYPWLFQSAVPDEVRGKENKRARDKWINTPDTVHQCYTAFTGVIDNLRVSEPKTGSEGNPPLLMEAFIADIDTEVSDEELQAGIARANHVPNYFERTLSGNARLIWLFEKPISFPNNRFAVEFLRLVLPRTNFEAIAPCFDKPAWETPNRLYTNSGEWKMIDPNARIPHDLLQGWIVEVAEKHQWKKDRGAIDIPLPVVWTELQKKYPGAQEWTTDFVEGAQGPSFWIDGSQSPKSAIVKSTGLYTFSAHATKPFYSWADLCGVAFAEKYTSEQMGKAVAGIYHDGKAYWRRDGYEDWKAFSMEDTARHLKVTRGLSAAKKGEEPSEVDRAIDFIQVWQGVKGAAPFVFQQQGLLSRKDGRYLNTHTGKALVPAAEKSVWGPEGKFPFWSAFFDNFFHPDSVPARPLDYFLAELQRFYRGCLYRNLESGHMIVFAGAAGSGKTLLCQGFIPALIGGSADAEDYLTGRSAFNSQLFDVALWNLDDSAASDAGSHKRASSLSKKSTANTTHAYNKKFQVPSTIDWLGRIYQTCNKDEESLKSLPDMSISNVDKVSLFLTTDHPQIFPAREKLLKIIEEEAPHFARWLLDWVPPPETQGTARFGITTYHEASLIKLAETTGRGSGFLDMLEEWRNSYFSESVAADYRGSSFHLYRLLGNDELTRSGLRGVSPSQFSSQLAALITKGTDWLSRAPDGRWVIARPAASPLPAPLPVGSTFQK